ncbi:response regulator transcription factor [Microbacterium maritypicum]
MGHSRGSVPTFVRSRASAAWTCSSSNRRPVGGRCQGRWLMRLARSFAARCSRLSTRRRRNGCASSGIATASTCSSASATTVRARSAPTTTRSGPSPNVSLLSTATWRCRRTTGWGTSLDIRLPLDPPAEAEPLEDSVNFSPRERDVLRLVASGARNRAIADQLGISDNTVKFHVSNLLRKTGARSRGELTAIAASSTRSRA